MTKKLSVVAVFCIGLMGLWASGAYALNLSGGSILRCPYPKHYVNGVCQSPILVDLSWGGIGNADKTLTDFIATLTPNTDDPSYPFRVLFRNPGGNTGGTSSVNFDDSTIGVSGGGNFYDFLTGKGKANTKTIFGDCDQCDELNPENPGGYEFQLPDDGKLWFLFDFDPGPNGTFVDNVCGSKIDPNMDPPPDRNYWLGVIDCIKFHLVENYSPGNADWWPYAVEIDNLDMRIDAFRDGVLAVKAEFLSCKVNDKNEYICTTTNINNNPK